MQQTTNKSIDAAKSLIDRSIEYSGLNINYRSFNSDINNYDYFYTFTNENVNAYMQYIDNNPQNALTVLASGDQPFNLVTKGVLDIDTFDINFLTEYFALGLKRAMILKYSREEFIDIILKIMHYEFTIEDELDFITGLFSYMDTEHKKFWQQIVDYFIELRKHAETKNLLHILSNDLSSAMIGNVARFVSNNNYLENAENYNKLKSLIGKANITFKGANAANLKDEFNRKYDIIMLSNILDYFRGEFGEDWNYRRLLKYEKELQSLSNKGGIIFLKYLFVYRGTKKEKIAFNSTVSVKNLRNGEKIERITFPYKEVTDAIIYKRVK
jgi:hypothetical protein